MNTRFINSCLNCGQPVSAQVKVYQGVVICDDCYKIVGHCIQRVKKELQMLFLVYTDMLRAALVKGELRPPPAVPVGKDMPPLEFTRAFKRMAEKYGGIHDEAKEGSDGQGPVSVLRVDQTDPDGTVQGR